MIAQPTMVEGEDALEQLAADAAEKARHCGFGKGCPARIDERASAGSAADQVDDLPVRRDQAAAERDVARLMQESVDALVRVAEQKAAERPHCRALAGFVVAVDQVQSIAVPEIESKPAEMSIGLQLQARQPHQRSSLPPRPACGESPRTAARQGGRSGGGVRGFFAVR